MFLYCRASLKIAAALVALLIILHKPALAQEENDPLCFDGEFRSVDGSVSGDSVDLMIDADSLVGKDLIIASNVSIWSQDSNEIRGKFLRIKCLEGSGNKVADYGLEFVISAAALGSVDDYKRIRRTLLDNTVSLMSLSPLQFKGQVNIFSHSNEPFIQVTDVVLLNDN